MRKDAPTTDNPFMNVPQVAVGDGLLALVRLCYRANRPLLVVGGTGVGKSQVPADFARSIGVRHIARDLSLMEPPDLVGLPRADGDRTRFLPPAFLPDSGEEGVLIIEELNRAPRYMVAPCLELLTARRLNDYVLPPGFRVVATINPAEDGFDAHELDPAVLARFVRVRAVPHPDEFVKWGRANGVDPRVLEYVRSDPRVFADPVSNPRAWAYVSDLLAAQARQPEREADLRAAVGGLVGPVRAAAFLKFCRQSDGPMAPAAVFADPAEAATNVAAWARAGRQDLIDQTVTALLKRVQSHAGFEKLRRDRRSWAAFQEFVAALPGEFRERVAEYVAEFDRPAGRRKK